MGSKISSIFISSIFMAVFSSVSAMNSTLITNETASAPPPDWVIVVSPYKTVVQVYNMLPNNEPFTIHCKSKDDDLGTHVIETTKMYEFEFRVNIIGSTLFFCGVSWKNASGVFDIYRARRDMKRCPTYCRWEVIGNGLYGYRQRKHRGEHETTDIDLFLHFPGKT